MTKTCESCRNQYKGDDEALRCRVHHNGLKCSPEAADDCKRYEQASETITVNLCDCQGRGD